MQKGMNSILVTGGGGFVGSHVAEFYAKKDKRVAVLDNLSRTKLLKKEDKNQEYNWNYLKKYENIELIKGDIRRKEDLSKAIDGIDAVIHCAAQTAVTTSVIEPEPDFTTNALGTFNVLEAVRKNDVKAIVYCSTNKVYGENVNKIPIEEGEKRYSFGKEFSEGVPEKFSIDLCEHTPYGCSKLAGDLYVQDYAQLYGIKTGVFRMSCIYGTRQFGVEDQGWVAWFTIAALTGKPITIYGDGKQVRDVLFVNDLVEAYDAFLESSLKQGVFNTGGGAKNTLSLRELIEILEEDINGKIKSSFSDWRPSDQKVYISDISKLKEQLQWEPKTSPEEGVKELIEWVKENKKLF
ncbi:MAG: NAD-dependent epimerase/dehydratase family protein [archaeon]